MFKADLKMIIPELLLKWHSNDTNIKSVIEFKGIIKLNKEHGPMVVVKCSLDVRSSVQCMNVNE